MLNGDGNVNGKKLTAVRLPSYTFYGENNVLHTTNFVDSCSLFFTAAHFRPCWPLAFLIFSPPV